MAHAHSPSIARYIAALKNDPIYRQEVANLHAANVADSADLGSGIFQSLVQRGNVPDFAAAVKQLGLKPEVMKWIMNHVDLPNATALAHEGSVAGTSQQGQLDVAHQTAIQNIKDTLAARGMLQSGATPELTGQEAQSYKAANFNADNALLGYINGAYASFAKNRSARATERSTDLQAAYARALKEYGAAGPPAIPGVKVHHVKPTPPESYQNYHWGPSGAPPGVQGPTGGGGDGGDGAGAGGGGGGKPPLPMAPRIGPRIASALRPGSISI